MFGSACQHPGLTLRLEVQSASIPCKFLHVKGWKQEDGGAVGGKVGPEFSYRNAAVAQRVLLLRFHKIST